MKQIIIFGLKDLAEIAWFYITRQTDDRVACFTVNREYRETESFKGLPVVEFEEIEKLYPPSEFVFFAPMSPSGMNRHRERIYMQAKQKGYSFYTFISPYATVLTDDIGENCFIFEDNTIQPFVKIGDNCVFWSGNHIGHHSCIHSHVFFSSHVVLSGHCEVKSYSYFGVNSTIRDFVTIEEGTFVGMSACITKNTEPWTVYIGVPAKPVGSSLEVKF